MSISKSLLEQNSNYHKHMAEDIGILYTTPDTVNVWLHNLKAWVVNYHKSTLQSSQWSIEQIVNSKNHSGMPG